MAVRIRLTRMGSKKKPYYRLIAAESQSPRDGKFLEVLGYYDPKTQPARIDLHKDKIQHWLERGATASESARAILKDQGLL
ncbi:MAG: 30S ribosomal protein S16 [Deltaproteobacteria bacterium HGW-Deltaproteobacteria-15]|jgi:small subunit ribosomal protein S16|nr:MAG: 30S ribosomal protein S16 [Deltaproteobacteria bacterium HGW-Deltaproteobacteria-15]